MSTLRELNPKISTRTNQADSSRKVTIIIHCQCTLRQAIYEYTKGECSCLVRCFERGLGAHVWDPEGNEYLDFLAAYS